MPRAQSEPRGNGPGHSGAADPRKGKGTWRADIGASSFFEVARQLDERVADIARRLLGEPNRALSTSSQLRYGTHGSLAIEIAGEKRGEWYDHENKVGGGVIDLVRRHRGLSNGRGGRVAGLGIRHSDRDEAPVTTATADRRHLRLPGREPES